MPHQAHRAVRSGRPQGGLRFSYLGDVATRKRPGLIFVTRGRPSQQRDPGGHTAATLNCGASGDFPWQRPTTHYGLFKAACQLKTAVKGTEEAVCSEGTVMRNRPSLLTS